MKKILRKAPIVIIDNSLEKFKSMSLFQDKVDEANEILRTVGLPKQWLAKKSDTAELLTPLLIFTPDKSALSERAA